MKFSYRYLDAKDEQALSKIIDTAKSHSEVVIRLHEYLLGNKITKEFRDDEIQATTNMSVICECIGLEALCDMIKVITSYFDTAYTFSSVSASTIKDVSSMELTNEYAKTDIPESIAILERYVLWKKLLISLMAVLNEYEICPNDWDDILNSELPPHIKINMICTNHITDVSEDECTPKIISEVHGKAAVVMRTEALKQSPDGHLLLVCDRLMKYASSIYHIKTGNHLEVIYDEQTAADTTSTRPKAVSNALSVNTFSAVSGYVPLGKRLVDCINEGEHIDSLMYQAEDGVVRILPGLRRLQGWSVYQTIIDGDIAPNTVFERVRVTKITVIGIRGVVAGNTNMVFSVENTCEEVIFDSLKNNNNFTSYVNVYYPIEIDGVGAVYEEELSVEFNPVSGELIIHPEHGYTRQVKVKCDFFVESDLTRIERESSDSAALKEHTQISHEDDSFTFKWVCSRIDEGHHSMYRFFDEKIITAQIPHAFVCALRNGHLKISINDSMFVTANGEDMEECTGLEGNIECPDGSGIYHATMHKKIDINIYDTGSSFVFEFMLPTKNHAIWCKNETIPVTLSLYGFDDDDTEMPRLIDDDNAKLAELPQVINQHDETFTFDWSCNDVCAEQDDMYRCIQTTLTVPQMFIDALHTGHLKISIDSSLFIVRKSVKKGRGPEITECTGDLEAPIRYYKNDEYRALMYYGKVGIIIHDQDGTLMFKIVTAGGVGKMICSKEDTIQVTLSYWHDETEDEEECNDTTIVVRGPYDNTIDFGTK